MVRQLFNLAILGLASTVFAHSGSSDHVISDRFGDWSVRHYFDSETLRHRFSDAKTPLKVSERLVLEFQFNVRASDGRITFIVPGWHDKVSLEIGEMRFVRTQGALHTFFGHADRELLDAVAKAEQPIRVELYSDGRVLSGTLSEKGSSAALRWIRAIE